MSIMKMPNGILRPIEQAPRDGRELLCTDGQTWRVCVPKRFDTEKWEYFRDDRFCPGHTWSMIPTHFIDLEKLPFAIDIRELCNVA